MYWELIFWSERMYIHWCHFACFSDSSLKLLVVPKDEDFLQMVQAVFIVLIYFEVCSI